MVEKKYILLRINFIVNDAGVKCSIKKTNC